MKAHAGRAVMRSLRQAGRHMRRNWPPEPERNRKELGKMIITRTTADLLSRMLMSPLPANGQDC